MTICICTKYLPDGFPDCSHLSRSVNVFNARERTYRCAKKMSQSFFERLITQDETWVYHYDPETKSQSMQWKHFDSPPPKKARVQPSAGKVMLTVFWDQDGVVMTDFLAKGTTITGTYYASLLRQLRESVKNKRHGKLVKDVLFYNRTMLQSTTPMSPKQKHWLADMKSCPIPLTLLTLHHLTFTSSQP